MSRDALGDRFRVRYFHRAADDMLVATVWFGPGTEGPPRHAHGGSVASVLDEAMGAAAWYAGYPVVAARLIVDFRAMVPVETSALVEARIERIEGRKIMTTGRMSGADGTVLAESEGLFVILDGEQLTKLAPRP